MKPSIFHRFLLVVLTLLGMVVGLLLLVMATGLYPLDTLRMGIDAYRTQLGTLNFALVMGGTGVVLFLLSLAILVGFNRGDQTPAQPPVTSALVSAGDYGTTQIALSAIDAMVQRHCKTNVRIREVASVITLQENGIGIQLKLSLLNDANIPETTEALRNSLREHIETLTGIQVREVSIMVVSGPSQALQK